MAALLLCTLMTEEQRQVRNERRKVADKKYRESHERYNADYNRQYHKEHSKYYRQYMNVWRKDNADKMKLYHKNRLKTDVQYRLGCCLRRRLGCALKGNQKVGSAVRDLGCSIVEFKKYIESQFQFGMTWDNYGYRGWHLDHKIPLAKFDLTDRQQFLIANNYTNIQPMWAHDNMVKHDLHVMDFRNGMF